MIKQRTYTHSSLAAARRCLREYDLRYNAMLEPDADDERETLEVGTTWHKAHEAHATGGVQAAYEAIAAHAPSVIWAAKLSRLFAAYHWYWKDQRLEVVQPEFKFQVEIGGRQFRGQMDGIVRISGQQGIHELKTTSDDVGAESNYWNRLRLDVQVGLYAKAYGKPPDFILYDVVRKPTINPKGLTKADLSRMQKELAKGDVTYFGEKFTPQQVGPAIVDEREDENLYGARLTNDIGDRPSYYFARRPVHRTTDDYEALVWNLSAQTTIIEYAEATDLMHRNPDACSLFGVCAFFGLCSNNAYPKKGDPIPQGFRLKKHRHPELDS